MTLILYYLACYINKKDTPPSLLEFRGEKNSRMCCTIALLVCLKILHIIPSYPEPSQLSNSIKLITVYFVFPYNTKSIQSFYIFYIIF